jgi:integrase
MATATAFIRTTKTDKNKSVNVRFRLRDGREIQLYHKSDITVNPNLWDEKREGYKAKCVISSTERISFNNAVSDRKKLILKVYAEANKGAVDGNQFEELIDRELHPDKYIKPKENETFFDVFDTFMEKRKMSDERKEGYKVIKRILQRFEMFVSLYENSMFIMDLEKISAETLEDLESFIRNEHTLYSEYPQLYKAFPEKRKPQPRGQNRINDIFSRIRAFFSWANETERASNNPFKKYTIRESVYGTPYYLTIDERNKIYSLDLSKNPRLGTQRDVFVFQCLIGCRVGDLYKLTGENIINGAIEYIPNKTKEGHPIVVRVPLNETAKSIVSKYKSTNPKSPLFPFSCEQKYNTDIKQVLTLAGIRRLVTVLNPTTRIEEKCPINTIASSHLARRTFIGNLYKKVKDPNLVGSLSGHAEGSKAFSRYRDIDEEMKTELVKMLE